MKIEFADFNTQKHISNVSPEIKTDCETEKVQPRVAERRNITPGAISALELASKEDGFTCTKSYAQHSASFIQYWKGVNASAATLLRHLIFITPARNWNVGGNIPMYATNERLADDLGCSTKTISRNLSSLVNAGLLAPVDSISCQRSARYSKDGQLEEFSGYCLSPYRENIPAIVALGKARREQRNHEQALKRRAKSLRRSVVKFIETLEAEGEDAQDMRTALTKTCQSCFDYEERVEALDTLRQLVFVRVAEMTKDAPVMVGNGAVKPGRPESDHCKDSSYVSNMLDRNEAPYKYTTDPITKNICNEMRADPTGSDLGEFEYKRAAPNGTDLSLSDSLAYSETVEMAFDKKPIRKARASALVGTQDESTGQDVSWLTASMLANILICCRRDLNVSFSDWGGLINQSDQFRLAVGLSPSGWQLACDQIGKHMAITLLAITAEKCLRDGASIGSPGGYFRASVERFAAGKFHLSKTLNGLSRALN